MSKSETQPSTRKLSEVARHVVAPDGIVTTAWPRVVAKCAEVGVGFDGWQHGAGTLALGKRANGKYAATVGGIVLSIPRQVGKTFLVGMIVIALCLIHPGLTVLWSAHRTRTATKTFGSLKGMTSRKKIAPHVLDPRNTNGEQEIRFVNGSVIMFGAREQGFGRGFDEVDVEVFDEAQILTEKALEDMVAAANQSRQEAGALLFFMGTPPRPTDPGEEWLTRRAKALSGKTKDMVFVEFSADPETGKEGGPSLDDEKQWAIANPSFPHRTPVESMLRMREQLTNDASFRREALGIHDEMTAGSRLISSKQWHARGVPVAPEGVKSFGVAFSLDGERVSLAGARKHEGGIHVELIDGMTGGVEDGLDALARSLADRWQDTATIVMSGRAGATVLHQKLRDLGVPEKVLHVASLPDYTTSCSMFHEALNARTVTHLAAEGQQQLDASVAVCDRKTRGTTGAWGWEATTPDGDETPVEAVSLAHWGAKTTKRDPNRKQRMVARR